MIRGFLNLFSFDEKGNDMRYCLTWIRCHAGPRPPFAWPVAYPLWALMLALRLIVTNIPTKRNRELRRIGREWMARQRAA